MARKTPIINDFRAGELAPPLDARADLRDYYRGGRILENMMPIIEGGVVRVPGTYYVRTVREFPTPPPWDFATDTFVPYDMCTDGNFLYICGAKANTTICKVVKLDIMHFSLIDSVEYDYGVIPNALECYGGIRYESGYIYLSGYANYLVGLTTVALVHKRPTSNLSTLTWAYTYSAAGLGCWFQEPEIDDNYVYATGVYDSFLSGPHAHQLTVKLDKSTGAEIWISTNTIHYLPVGINQSGDFLYTYKNIGTILGITKISKSDPATYTNYTYVSVGTFYRGCLDGTNIYVSGITPLSGVSYTALVFKINMATMAKTWEYDRDTSPGDYDDFQKCVKDDTHIYAEGVTKGTPYDTMLEKLDFNGNLIASKRIVGKQLYRYTIVQYGDYLYHADPVGVERRSKSSLEVVP